MDKNNNDVKITTYDKLLRAWQNSMELARDFEVYSKEVKDNDKVKEAFAKFAEDECLHAAKFRELILEYQRQ